jgi:glycosyltransferase involved in cell wall biosynthesis
LIDLKTIILKILQISSAQAFGGGERHLADLANALASRGHEVHATLRPHSPLIEELQGLSPENITTLPLRNALDAISARKLSRYVREHKIEIVHAHMARDYPLASFAARRNPDCKLIITRHVLFPLNRLHSITLRHVACIIAVSEAVARQLRAQSSISAAAITVVPNGIDVARFKTEKREEQRNKVRRQWNVPGDALLVGTVGEITALKGHEDFLRSASIVRGRFPQARFLIAGVDASKTGENQASLAKLIAALDLAGSVQVAGWIEDLASFYLALDVFVSASHTESFGLAIAEAMASATPVVATATEGASEIITNGNTGLLVPIADARALSAAVISLLENQERRGQFALSGRRRVEERFSLARMVDDTERIYQTVLDK